MTNITRYWLKQIFVLFYTDVYTNTYGCTFLDFALAIQRRSQICLSIKFQCSNLTDIAPSETISSAISCQKRLCSPKIATSATKAVESGLCICVRVTVGTNLTTCSRYEPIIIEVFFQMFTDQYQDMSS